MRLHFYHTSPRSIYYKTLVHHEQEVILFILISWVPPPFWCYISRNFVNWKIKKIKKVENGASVRKDGDKHQGVGNTVLTDWVGEDTAGDRWGGGQSMGGWETGGWWGTQFSPCYRIIAQLSQCSRESLCLSGLCCKFGIWHLLRSWKHEREHTVFARSHAGRVHPRRVFSLLMLISVWECAGLEG